LLQFCFDRIVSHGFTEQVKLDSLARALCNVEDLLSACSFAFYECSFRRGLEMSIARAYAYSSRSEFIKDAIRRFLEYYSYYPSSKRNSKKEEQHVDLTQEDIASLLTRIVNKGTK
jgi:Arc/MetJ-type ribon-helix-helix transcriptional regulator